MVKAETRGARSARLVALRTSNNPSVLVAKRKKEEKKEMSTFEPRWPKNNIEETYMTL